MDAAKWPQGFPEIGLVTSMEEIVSNTCNSKPKTRPQEQLNCPRCNSTNTKFCYYNNYSLTQPRYFCKTCRRYWTEGGSLRNVPVGGGSRKNKRSISSSSSASSSITKLPDLNPPPTTTLSHFSNSYHHHQQNPNKNNNTNMHHKPGQDLNLSFQLHDMSQYVEIPNKAENNNSSLPYSTTSSPISALDLLRTGIASRGGLNSFIPNPMPDSNTLLSSGFQFHDIKPNLNFSIDGLGNNTVQGNGSGRLFFPFGDHQLKQLSNTSEVDHDHHQNKGQQGNSTGYWNGMFGNGESW